MNFTLNGPDLVRVLAAMGTMRNLGRPMTDDEYSDELLSYSTNVVISMETQNAVRIAANSAPPLITPKKIPNPNAAAPAQGV